MGPVRMFDPWCTAEESNPLTKIKKELNESKELREVTNALRDFQKETDSSKQVTLFLNFLSLFESFLVDDKSSQIAKHVIPSTYSKIVECTQLAIKSLPTLVQIIRILSTAFKISPFIPKSRYVILLFISICKESTKQKKLMTLSNDFFTALFKIPSFTLDFANSGGYVEFLKQVICGTTTSEILDWATHILIDDVNPQIFEKIDVTTIFSAFNSIGGSIAISVSSKSHSMVFVSKVLLRAAYFNPKTSTLFRDTGGYHTYDLFYETCINELPNKYSPLQIRLQLLRLSVQKYPQTLQQNIFSVCKHLSHNPTDSIETYNELFEIIYKQIVEQKFSIETLIQIRFVDCFIAAIKTENLAKLIDNSDFIQIGKAAFSEHNEIAQATAFSAFLKVTSIVGFSTLIFTTLSDLIEIAPTTAVVKCLLERTTESNDSQFCDILLASIDKIQTLAESFIEAKGLKWLRKSFESGLITIELFSSFLSSLVVQRRFDEIENLIQKLPKDHPLFSLPKPAIEKIVFGMSRAKYRPIRVYSLFHLIDPPATIDPYNAWMLGNCVLDLFLKEGHSIFDFPQLLEVGNRFLHPRHIDLLLERPFEVGKFCSPKFDHFSLFQFYQGRDELSITRPFKCISFWLRFLDDKDTVSPFFRTDGLTLSSGNDEIWIQIEGKEAKAVSVDTSEWNFIYISMEEYFRSNTIVVSIQGTVVFKGTKPTKSDFTFACFGSIGNNLMFIGPAIRLFKIIPKDTSLLLQNGPGYIDALEAFRLETMITPYFFTEPTMTAPNSSMSKSCKIPHSCVAVPYFGFPFHFISMRKNNRLLQILSTAQTDTEFRSLFYTLLKINVIIVHSSLRFWPKILGSLKKNRKFVSKDIFVKALRSVSKHQKREQLLSSILFDSDMWLSVDNGILVTVLFDYFSDFDWRQIEDFELFLATVILRNPTSTAILESILRNHQKFPIVLKYISSIMKIGHVLDAKTITWDLLTARFMTPVQKTIVECLINYVSPETIKYLTPIFTFKKLKHQLVVAPKEMAIKLFHLITTIARCTPDYIEVDSSLMHAVAMLSDSLEVWDDVLALITDNTERTSMQLVREECLPLILVLVWALSLCHIHISVYKIECVRIQKFADAFDFGVTLLHKHIPAVLASPNCDIVLRSWFPLVFSYPRLLQSMMDTGGDNASRDFLVVSQLSEACDPTWSGKEQVIKSIRLPPMPPPVPSIVFVVEMMTAVLRSHGYDFTVQSEVDHSAIGKWLGTSIISRFLADVVLNSPDRVMRKYFYAIFLSVPFYDRIRSVNYVPVLIRILLERFAVGYTPAFPLDTLMLFIQFFVSSKFFLEKTDQFIEMLLTALEAVDPKSREFTKAATTITAVLLDLVLSAPSHQYPMIISSFHQHTELLAALVTNSKTQKTWLYVFHIMSIENATSMCQLINSFMQLARVDAKDRTISKLIMDRQLESNPELFKLVQNDWIEKTTAFTKETSKLSIQIAGNRGTFSADFKAISNEVMRTRYVANSKHYLTAHLFSRKLMCLDSTFTLIEERMHWSQFIISVRDNSADVSLFDPKTFHLSPRCFPYHAPRLISPSPFELQDFSVPDHKFSSPIVELFRKNSKSLFQVQSAEVSLYELFIRTTSEYGEPLATIPCKLKRYCNSIPSVLFIYQKRLMILTHANFTHGEIELKPTSDEKDLHIFLESVFLGHWGHTSIFASHIVIIVEMESMIFSRRHTPKEIEVWTFRNGHFILKMKNWSISKVFPLLERYSMLALKQLSGYQFLFRTNTGARAYSQWMASVLSTDQFLLVMNGLANRSFIDLDKFPFFPQVTTAQSRRRRLSNVDGMRPPGAAETLNALKRILPFTYFHATNVPQPNTETPAILFYAPEFYTDLNHTGIGDKFQKTVKPVSYVQTQRDLLENQHKSPSLAAWTRRLFGLQQPRAAPIDEEVDNADRVSQNHSNIADLELFHVCQQINRPVKKYQTLLFERNTIRKIRLLSARLEATMPYFVKIDKRCLTLSCLNKQTKQVFCAIVDPQLAFACSLDLSVNGMFLVVDFEFGLSRTYRILYDEKQPASIKMISDFSWSGRPMSSISGADWIVATARDTHVLIWEIFTGSVHRDIRFKEQIEAVAIDEENGGVWIVSETHTYYYSINGELMAKTRIHETVTAIAALQLHPADRDRTAILGCENGHIYVISPRPDQGTVDFKRLPSMHEAAVNRLVLHPTLREFVSIDEDGVEYVWNAIGLDAPNQKAKIFSHCACCENPAQIICTRCNRAMCPRCISEQRFGIVCSHCVALASIL